MSEFERKYDAAMKELEATEMWPSNYLPLIYRLYQKLGVKARPPHYANFLSTFVGQGLFFGVFWGLFMWLFEWRGTDVQLDGAVSSALIAGAFFGGVMTLGYAHGHRKWKLTKWDDL